MECVVEGHTISEEEWSDDSWQSPGYRAQERRRRELQNQGKPVLQPCTSENARAAVPERQPQVKSRPPRLRRRAPLPRLPQDSIHIVGRPRTPIDLTKVPPWQLHDALLKAASLPDQPPASRDRLRTHPTNNTFTLSVIDSQRAQAYLRVKSITIGAATIELHVYAPPPDDAIRGIMFHAYDDFSDEEILADLQASNPTIPIVSGRRLGQTRHVVVALMTPNLPKWIFYHGTDIRLYPFYNRVESCFNCRKVGHRTDVCPMPRKQRCRRCGEEHPTPGQGETPACTPRCIVCNGAHNTGSSNCKYRFIKKAPPTPQSKQEAQEPSSNIHRNPSHSDSSSRRSPSSRDHSASFPPLGNSSNQQQRRESRSPSHTRRSGSRSAKRRGSRCRSHSRRPRSRSAQRRDSRPSSHSRSKSARRSPSVSRSSSRGPGEASKSVAWQRGAPASLLFSDSQVRELAKENSALKAQISAQQSQIAKLTSYIQSLEAKIDRALSIDKQTTPTSSETQDAHPNPLAPNPALSPVPQLQNANKRKAATPTASLHADADITTKVTTAVTAAISTLKSDLNAEIETRFNAIHQTIRETTTSFAVLKSSTEAALADFSVQLAIHRTPSNSRQTPAPTPIT
ncbi:hypothetical protein HPB51_026513 [Rhipicephalus microplus]|uniref:CCHC-type domain-containing protein n=1 Tax=Rhipicephalus microplus TaxID=6941 RepID=A0A9J6D2Y4_RHIMP|nr:hypothetical protein HPB51_026513 [Rhipicephalus microplus]